MRRLAVAISVVFVLAAPSIAQAAIYMKYGSVTGNSPVDGTIVFSTTDLASASAVNDILSFDASVNGQNYSASSVSYSVHCTNGICDPGMFDGVFKIPAFPDPVTFELAYYFTLDEPPVFRVLDQDGKLLSENPVESISVQSVSSTPLPPSLWLFVLGLALLALLAWYRQQEAKIPIFTTDLGALSPFARKREPTSCRMV